MQTNLLELLCKKNALSYIIFDQTFHIVDTKNIVVQKDSDIRDFLWEIVGLEENILALEGTHKKIDIPMILRDKEYYDLEIESFESQERETLFIAYMQQKSQHTHTYADVIREVNKKTLIYDISDEKKENQYYKQINKQLITFHVDLDGIITLVNDAYIHFFNLEKDKVIGKHFTLFFDAKKSQLNNETNIFSAKNTQDKRVFFHITVIPLTNSEGRVIENIIIAQDISYLKHMKQELEYASQTDTLTGLPNRHLLLKKIDKEISNNNSFGICFLDIDDFSTINEEYGAHAGDMLLKYFTTLLETFKESEDLLARVESDMFAILFHTQKSRNYIEAILESLQEVQNNSLTYTPEDIIEFSFTTTVLYYPDHAKDAKEFLGLAKKEIKRSKITKKLSR
jgi:diguanylate cyclase (GGDEF)-like protein